jgi:hypothetical protein
MAGVQEIKAELGATAELVQRDAQPLVQLDAYEFIGGTSPGYTLNQLVGPDGLEDQLFAIQRKLEAGCPEVATFEDTTRQAGEAVTRIGMDQEAGRVTTPLLEFAIAKLAKAHEKTGDFENERLAMLAHVEEAVFAYTALVGALQKASTAHEQMNKHAKGAAQAGHSGVLAITQYTEKL